MRVSFLDNLVRMTKMPHMIPKKDIQRLRYVHPGHKRSYTIVFKRFLKQKYKKKIYMHRAVLKFDLRKKKVSKVALKEIVKNRKGQRFIALFMLIKNNDVSYHLNAIIIDTKLRRLERFEPVGPDENRIGVSYMSIDESSKIYNSIAKQIEDVLKIQIAEIIEPIVACPFNIGLQLSEQREEQTRKMIEFNRKYEIRGYCAAWSMMYICIRINNPKLDSPTIHKEIYARSKGKHGLSTLIRAFYYNLLKFRLKNKIDIN